MKVHWRVNTVPIETAMWRKSPRRQFYWWIVSCGSKSRFRSPVKMPLIGFLHLNWRAEERRAPLERFLDKFSESTPRDYALDVCFVIRFRLWRLLNLGNMDLIEVWLCYWIRLSLRAVIFSTAGGDLHSGCRSGLVRCPLIKGGWLKQLGRVKNHCILIKRVRLRKGKPTVTDLFECLTAQTQDFCWQQDGLPLKWGHINPLAKALSHTPSVKVFLGFTPIIEKLWPALVLKGIFLGKKIQ